MMIGYGILRPSLPLPIRSTLALLLIASVATAQQVPAQPAPAPANPAGPMVPKLKILVLEGEGAVNDVEKQVMAPTVVEVRDDNDKPVEGAQVMFRFPAAGPSAYFLPDRKTSMSFRTNSQGQAEAAGAVPNRELGRFKIHVIATIANLTGETTITQTNARNVRAVLKPQRSLVQKLGWWKLSAIGGGAAALGIVLATRGGGAGTSPTPVTISITPGPVVIGGSR